MKTSLHLICLGVESYRHPVLFPYLMREIGKLGWRIASSHALHTLDPEIPIRLRQLLEEEGSGPCLIAADPDHFPLAGRVLATLKGEAMILSETGTLVPADVREVRRDSYLFRFGGRMINVIRIEPGCKLPELLLEPRLHRSWQLFPETPRELERLRRLELEEPDALDLTEILPGWIRIESYGASSPTLTLEALYQVTDRVIPGDSIVEALITYLAARKKRITFAESCTGGLLAATFTAQPGASDILEGSYVTYANRIKSGWLGVREETLREHGAVSRECVLEMAAGAQRGLPADIAIAISGIAGPTGAVPGKPIGTVYLCLRNGDTVRVERLQLHGDRNAIQEQSVLYALKFLVESEKEKIFKFFSENS